jgi:hypothetical protein
MVMNYKKGKVIIILSNDCGFSGEMLSGLLGVDLSLLCLGNV